MKIIIILTLSLLLLSNATMAKFQFKHPDLSKSKPAIQKRHNELIDLVNQVEAQGSDFKLADIVGRLGMFYQVHEMTQAAAVAYDRALELSPNNSKWLYMSATLKKSQGDFDQAKTLLQKSWRYNDRYLPTLIHLANINKQEGNFDQAKNYFQKALTINENSAIALVGIGQIMAQSGDFHKAIDNYKKALTIQPNANQINFLLSQAYAATSDMKKAQQYNRLKGKSTAQMYDPLFYEMYEESRSASYYNEKAVMMYMQNDYEGAEKTAKLAQSYDNDSLYPNLTLANIYTSSNREKKAVRLLESLISKHKNNEGLFYSLGVIEEILGNDEKSGKWYKKALEVNPEMQQAVTTLPSTLMRLGKYDEALIQLNKAVKLNPENALLMYRQASILAYKNKCKQSSKKVYEAVTKEPKNFALLTNFVKIAVHCDVSKQMQTDALNAARNMYQISQDDIVVETLAMIESKTGNKQNAIDYQAQLIFNQLTKKTTKNIKKYKSNLELYKKGKYPCCLFKEGDVDLFPPRIQNIR